MVSGRRHPRVSWRDEHGDDVTPCQVLHQMRLEATDDETEIWVCDECGKRIQLWPGFAILNPGDLQVRHWGSLGGLSLGPIEVAMSDV